MENELYLSAQKLNLIIADAYGECISHLENELRVRLDRAQDSSDVKDFESIKQLGFMEGILFSMQIMNDRRGELINMTSEDNEIY